MKRKIAAIMAADIAGYSKLVAEDEEETLRRLASYRAVFDDFITRFSGRIFNTAGDAVLAEFPSAVEAVRCAIDVQESIRTRNLAYLASRHMSFRIGITIGDVVERDGDLLGDGVNIAARLEGLAQPGGMCVSRTVYEQVANKLSVEFVDIGEQSVKNIPTPIHAYTLSLGAEEPRAPKALPQKKPRSAMWPIAITAASLAALGGIGFAYQAVTRGNAIASQAALTVEPTIPAPQTQAPQAPALHEKQPVQGALTPERARSDPDASRSNSEPEHALAASEHASEVDIKTPCRHIRIACEQAGFVFGALRDGSGLQVDCIRPIMRGTPQPRIASRPLPQIDPQIVEACRARNPMFGELPMRASEPGQMPFLARPVGPPMR
jgi:class 3 adenylate cyclase